MPQQPPAVPDEPHYLRVTPSDPSQTVIDHTANPLEHYPWATAIAVPDATFGATSSGADSYKTKYNLVPGTVLPPMQHIQASYASKQRKEIFKNADSITRPMLP